jgi:hypothetical protein
MKSLGNLIHNKSVVIIPDKALRTIKTELERILKCNQYWEQTSFNIMLTIKNTYDTNSK